jgi:hypothetical protein
LLESLCSLWRAISPLCMALSSLYLKPPAVFCLEQ